MANPPTNFQINQFVKINDGLSKLIEIQKQTITELRAQIADLNRANAILTADLQAYEKAQTTPETPARAAIMGQQIADAAAAFDIRKWNACGS